MKFMRAHGIPLEGLNSGRTRVLIVDAEKEVVDTLEKILTEQTSYEIHTATSAFGAGMECERFKPHVVLLDIHLGESDAKAFADSVRKNEQLQFTKIVGMSSKLTDGQSQALRLAGYDSFLKKPFQVRQVVEAIEAATNLVH
jgi:DNA-binding response OmpR family regulator